MTFFPVATVTAHSLAAPVAAPNADATATSVLSDSSHAVEEPDELTPEITVALQQQQQQQQQQYSLPPPADNTAAVQQHIQELEQLRPQLNSQLLRLVLLHTLYTAVNGVSAVQMHLQQQQQQSQQQRQLRQQEAVALQMQLLNLQLQQSQQQQQQQNWLELLQLLFLIWQLHRSLTMWQQTADDLVGAAAADSSNAASIIIPALVVWWFCRMLLPPFFATVLATVAAGLAVLLLLSNWANNNMPTGSSTASRGNSTHGSSSSLSTLASRQYQRSASLKSNASMQPVNSGGSAGSDAAAATTALELSQLSLSFQISTQLSDLPPGISIAQLPDPASSAVGYSSWAVQLTAAAVAALGAAAAVLAAGSWQQQQQQGLLLLHTLPEHRYRAIWKQRGGGSRAAPRAAAGRRNDDDTLNSQDQGQQQHQQQQGAAGSSSSSSTTVQLTPAADHAILGSGVLSKKLPGSALLQALSHLTQQQQQQQQQCGMFAPILLLCLTPPMMLEALPPGTTLAEWLLEQQLQQRRPYQYGGGAFRYASSSSSSSSSSWQPPFAAELWPQVLTWLGQVAAALQEMHRRRLVHGGVQAGAVHLVPKQQQQQQQQQQELVAKLSLAAPWQAAVTPGRVVDPAFAPPEVQVQGRHPAGSSPVDSYGFGMLMWQVASGWVPQQQQQQQRGSRFDEIEQELEVYEELQWCGEMMHIYGTTFPGAIGHRPNPAVAAGSSADAAAVVAALAAEQGYRDAASFCADLAAVSRHGMVPAAAEAWLPKGYWQLMVQCCSSDAGRRPDIQHICQQLQQLQ
jgi:hypothetical protein